MYPVPEDSGGETGSSAADLVEDSALTAGEGKQVTWFKVSGTGGFRSSGARGNKFTWLKYPAPEDSGVYIYRYSGNRFPWSQVSGTGGFYRSRSEGLTGSLRIIRHRRIGNTYLPCFICRVK